MAPCTSGPMGQFAVDGASSWRLNDRPRMNLQPRTIPLPLTPSPPSSLSSSPSSTPPSSPPFRRRRSSSSSSSSSQNPWVTSNWRSGQPRQKAPTVPSYDQLQLGEVLFLPDQQPGPDSIIFNHPTASNSQPWGHPVVITGKFLEGKEECVRIRICTSFVSQRIEDHKKSQQRHMYVLADNEQDVEPHKGTRLAKMAPGSGKLPKRSYINLSRNEEMPIEYKNLVQFKNRPPMRFDPESTQRIINCESY